MKPPPLWCRLTSFSGSARKADPAILPWQVKATNAHPIAWVLQKGGGAGTAHALQELCHHCVRSTDFSRAVAEQLNALLADHGHRLI